MTPYIIIFVTGLSFLLNVIASHSLKKIANDTREATISGDKMALSLLALKQINSVKIRKSETLGENYYDPLIKVIQLDPNVFGRQTIYSLAVGSHEACHAIKFQYLRFLLVPVSMIAKFVFIPLFLLAFFIDSPMYHGFVLLFYVLLLFIKLIIEVLDEVQINSMSIKLMQQSQVIPHHEIQETKKIYRFFNYTYLASLPLKVIFHR